MPRNARAAAVPPDLREGVDAFLGHLSLERGLAKLTVAAYEGDLLAFAAHCGRAGFTRWPDVGLAQVDAWVRTLDRRGQAPASLARRLSAVRLPGLISPAEVARIVTAPDAATPQGLRDRAMLELMYGSGLRVSELCGLDLQAIDEESGVVRVRGKGSKDRLVPVGETSLTVLRSYLAAGRPALVRPKTGSALFLSARGVAISRKTFWLAVKQAAARAGLPPSVKPHLLRHAFATHLLAGGADLRSIQEMLGHADIATTQIYASVERSALADAHRRHHPRGRKA